jgi:hypothetical protein
LKGRKSPAGGYEFGSKKQYRRDVWALARRWSGTRRHAAKCLLMPSSEGSEVEVAKAAGFREPNLFLVDHNAAIVAHLKRRYRLSHCYGVTVERAIDRIYREGHRLDIVNLDLCGPAGEYPFSVVWMSAVSGVLADRALIFVTMLRGRERRSDSEILRGLRLDDHGSNLDQGRRLMMQVAGMGALPWNNPAHRRRRAFVVSERSYRSSAGSQTMLWLAIDTHSVACSCRACSDFDARLGPIDSIHYNPLNDGKVNPDDVSPIGAGCMAS